MLAIFTATIGISAFLLFSVQPLISKLLMPVLGGAPAVWNTLLCFFQALLLAGYVYAHLLQRCRTMRIQVLLHILVVCFAMATLPIMLPATLPDPNNPYPMAWVLQAAFSTIGLPFFVLASTSPLLMAWFARSDHQLAADPYPFYAISNLGSMVALLSYPFVVEYFMTLPMQTWVWQGGFIACGLLLVACGMLGLLANKRKLKQPEPTPHPTWKTRLTWVVLAFAPSSLLLGTTGYINTTLLSMPLLWILPLALYLLTFVFAFARKPLISETTTIWAATLSLGAVGLSAFAGAMNSWAMVGFHLLALFTLALACHTALAIRKPAADHLTEFYVWLSLGGVLGGAFNALIAPIVFDDVFEYPLAIFLCCVLLKPILHWHDTVYGSARLAKWNALALDIILPLLMVGVTILSRYRLLTPFGHVGFSDTERQVIFSLGAMLGFIAFSLHRPFRQGLGVALVLVTLIAIPRLDNNFIGAARSFFGVYTIGFNPDTLSNNLWSGHKVVIQGSQSILPEQATNTLFFYPLEGIKSDLPALIYTRPMGVIGLGVGTIACLAEPKQKVTFFEIDPVVSAITQAGDNFTYLKDCPGSYTVELGDGRLKLGTVPDHTYGMLVLDAFSGASIPAHLLTAEAFHLYFSKLKDDGVLLINLTNPHLNLEPLIAAQANTLGLTGLLRKPDNKRLSTFAVLAKQPAYLGALTHNNLWEPLPQTTTKPWTDHYTSILGLLK